MKITVEVTITAYRTDGTQVQVTNGARKQTGDNPRFAGDEAAEVADAATKASLSGFRAAMEPQPAQPSEQRTAIADLRNYVMNALDTAQVPLDADAARARSMLLDAGLDRLDIAATDAELESFQALRRQIMAGPDARVDSLIRTLDQLGAGNGLGPAELGDLLVQHRIQVPEHGILRAASDIRCARKD